jgi:hypothetical protein
VQAVYVEATAEETESRLLKGIGKRCPDLPENLGLVESLAALRRARGLAAGQKVLIVLDQFEQWLHARRGEDNTELVQALRHCDGSRVQCVVMVRDDFWLAASRFFQALEVRLVEGENSALVDLFDARHAKKVLTAFGRAFGALPDNLLKEHTVFLDKAVAGLAQDGKVISVRLALFAEMVKGKPWTPATLKEVGGTEGVGVAFLEETFSAPTAPPQHRLHQKAARSVLKALLPEQGTDIKGNMRSGQELLEASGYAGRPRDFESLLRMLDSELRLVTPTEHEGVEGGRYFQLTHDYLVPSLREWLTKKQKETRRGRAELRLGERSAAWTAKQESRNLPAWWEWLNIHLFTRKCDWTTPQRMMMAKAGRLHAMWGMGLAVLLAIVTVAGLWVVEQNRSTHAAGLVQRLLYAETAGVPDIVAQMEGYRRWTDPLLWQEIEHAEDGSRRKLHASLALLPVDRGQVEYLYHCLLDAELPQLPVIRDALAGHKGALTGRLWSVVEKSDKFMEAIRHFKMAIALPKSLETGKLSGIDKPWGKQGRRLRAAAALAAYDPDSPRWEKVRAAVAADMVAVPTVHLVSWMDALRPVGDKLIIPLSTVFRDVNRRETERSLATDLLADYAADRPKVLAELLMDADEKQFAVLYPKVLSHRERAVSVLNETVKTPVESKKTDDEKETLAKRQANASVALLRMGQAEQVWPVLKHSPDPRARSYLIHRLSPLGAAPAAIVRRLEQEKEVSGRRALLLSLGEFGLPAGERERLIPVVRPLYRQDPDAGLHGAAEWLLRQWKKESELKEFEQGWVKDEESGRRG